MLAKSGINDPRKLLASAPDISTFADVQYLNNGTSFEEGAKTAVQLAHLYRAYSGAPLRNMLDAVTKLSVMMPDSIGQYLTQASYYRSTFSALRVPDQQSLILGAWIDRMGMGRGKGGTALNDFLQEQVRPSQVTGHAEEVRRAALRQLGLITSGGNPVYMGKDANGKWQFDALKSLTAIEAASKRMNPVDFVREVKTAFPATGDRFAQLFADTSANGPGAMLRAMLRQFNSLPGMYAMQAQRMDTFKGALALARSNFSSLMIELLEGWLPDMKRKLQQFGNAEHSFQMWLHQHKTAERLLGGGLFVALGVSSAAAAINVWNLNRSILALGGSAGAANKAGIFAMLAGVAGFIRTFAANGLWLAGMGAMAASSASWVSRIPLLGAALGFIGRGLAGLAIAALDLGTAGTIGWLLALAAAVTAIVWACRHPQEIKQWAENFASGMSMIVQGIKNVTDAARLFGGFMQSMVPGGGGGVQGLMPSITDLIANYVHDHPDHPAAKHGPAHGGGHHVTVHHMQVSMEGVNEPKEFVRKLIDHFQTQGATSAVPTRAGLSLGKSMLGNVEFGNT